MAEFLNAYKRTAVHEGGYANVKGDRGGETYKGISRVNYPNWEGWKIVDENKPLKQNAVIKSDKLNGLVSTFYKRNFWDKIKGDYITDQPIADFLYDYFVHSGKRAVISLQEILNVTPDGIFGAKTLSALNNADEDSVFLSIYEERRTFLIALSKKPNQSKFKTGWLIRVDSYVT